MPVYRCHRNRPRVYPIPGANPLMTTTSLSECSQTSLRGRPPQSNYPPSSVLAFRELETRCAKVRISTSTPRGLAPPPRCLRTILHITHPVPMLSCSKGSRGLFVPLRVIGIFTDTTISPSSPLRQCPDHYTIRAGRNLPDKEFRYLRTVIVTAAVYRGFNSKLLLR